MNELKGLCVYCNKPAKYTCQSCGALVCSEHYNAKTKTCKSCSAGRRI